MSDHQEKFAGKEKNRSQSQRYLNFGLGPEEYAISLQAVKEVIAVPEITPVPYTPSHFLGIMNLRGQVISVIDLRLKFAIKADSTPETAVIIVDLKDHSLGMIVSSVNSVLALDEADVSPKPEIHSSKNTDYITGVAKKDKKLVLLLDIAKALSAEEHAAINRATAQPAKKAA
ncbi:MAG TPA: chemotaxis protein CheW [Bdellovibrionales bacterium]|nr:MAG: hypothetical protein A2X97_15095 [Bdellovibrionales bacterium GWA1_52_35]OFZ35439.1 MAG: hypothetical protein A2070_12265 [Bdellovibrionales bacterium GWC1_52_8]HAR43141.1 chemotaxis protein CheW [Bdellovibrionales bacterium]HCM40463.1 chemotaxis protein CheW [Bdellovibrionales bacterium]